MMMSAVVVGWRPLRHRSSNLSPDAANLHLCRDRRLFHGAFGQTAKNNRPRIPTFTSLGGIELVSNRRASEINRFLMHLLKHQVKYLSRLSTSSVSFRTC